MPEDAGQRQSLAYRKARDAIWKGVVPEKYTRLLSHINHPERVLELGSAEGVLALLLSRLKRADLIIALELREERHNEAKLLAEHWRTLGHDTTRVQFEVGDIRRRLDLLDGVKLLVAVRSIYYLREDAVSVLWAAAVAKVKRVMLVGNSNRQAQHRQDPHSDLGKFNRLAATEGMSDLLKEAGYRVFHVEPKGDPIVVGAL